MMATTNALLSRFLVAGWLAFSTGGSPAFIAAGPAPAAAATAKGKLTLPRVEGSVRFGIMGDTGRGERQQMEVAAQMAAFHEEFPYTLVIMLGDNIYGTDSPADMKAKFDTPYKPLLDAGVEFRASLGNHDNPNQRFYKPFNMDGQRYYSFRPKNGPDKDLGSVRFFVIDSNYIDKEQLDWLDKELAASDSQWKIAYFHHPLYSSGRGHGSALETRAVLEPLFVKYGVSAVFAGHDHFYERTKPQKGGIVHWVSGAGGSLRKGDIRPTDMTAKGFDSDMSFMLAEIVGDDMYFEAISRTGATVDSGVFHRPGAPPAGPAASPSPVPVEVPSVAPGGRTTPEGPASPKPADASPLPSPSPSAAATPVRPTAVSPSPSATKAVPRPATKPAPRRVPSPAPSASPRPSPRPSPSASPRP